MRKPNKRSASELLYNQYFNRVPVSIMKLGEIDKAIKAIIAEGNTTDVKHAQLLALVDKYREAVTPA